MQEISNKFRVGAWKKQLSMVLLDLIGCESRRQKRKTGQFVWLLICGFLCGPMILEGRDGLCIAHGFGVLWKRMNEKLIVLVGLFI